MAGGALLLVLLFGVTGKVWCLTRGAVEALFLGLSALDGVGVSDVRGGLVTRMLLTSGKGDPIGGDGRGDNGPVGTGGICIPNPLLPLIFPGAV